MFRIAVRSLAPANNARSSTTGSSRAMWRPATSSTAAPTGCSPRRSISSACAHGPSVPVVENALTANDSGTIAFSLAADGTLVYLPAVADRRPHADLGRSRGQGRTPAAAARARTTYPALSPDGRRVAVQISEGAQKQHLCVPVRHRTAHGGSLAKARSPDRLVAGRKAPDLCRPPERGATYSLAGARWQRGRRIAGRQPEQPLAGRVDAGRRAPGLRRVPPTEINDIKLLRRGNGTRRRAAGRQARRRICGRALSPNGQWIAYVVMRREPLKCMCGRSPEACRARFPRKAASSRAGRAMVARCSTGAGPYDAGADTDQPGARRRQARNAVRRHLPRQPDGPTELRCLG